MDGLVKRWHVTSRMQRGSAEGKGFQCGADRSELLKQGQCESGFISIRLFSRQTRANE